MTSEANELVQGRLHVLILKTLTLEALHLYGIGVRLERSAAEDFSSMHGHCSQR